MAKSANKRRTRSRPRGQATTNRLQVPGLRAGSGGPPPATADPIAMSALAYCVTLGFQCSALTPWPAGDLQYRPEPALAKEGGQPVHERRFHRHPETARLSGLLSGSVG